jgi:AraC family transcriptional regulator of adaptative response / DNA-3-methyladenine glycosylase II
VNLNADQCYQAVITRDARFDGRFFVAVKTTRIYCRPICRVKTPRPENCRFFSHAAAAEAAGFRPCKRCRPELAPGGSPMEARSQLARAAASQIAQDFLTDHSLGELARELGVTDRQMRRQFREEFGVSPVAFWQTRRLLQAKQLLTDSRLPVISVALASGFRSLRRFNALFKSRYRMSPTALRRQPLPRPAGAMPGCSFRLGYRAPFDWEQLLAFLARRAIPQVEAVANGVYARTVRVTAHGREYAGQIQVRHEAGQQQVVVDLSDPLLPVCAPVLERVKRLFDLEADPQAINAVLGALAACHPGLRVPGGFDGFELAVRAILGQQVSVAAARTLAGRVALRFGAPLTAAQPALSRTFPQPVSMATAAVEDFIRLGLTRRRAETLRALAATVVAGSLKLEPLGRVDDTLNQLRRIPGLGEWTAQYIALRALAWPDGFPHTDLGLRKALGLADPKAILQRAERWRPWRGYAAMHLWHSLETNS